jgi:hypothetical protein
MTFSCPVYKDPYIIISSNQLAPAICLEKKSTTCLIRTNSKFTVLNIRALSVSVHVGSKACSKVDASNFDLKNNTFSRNPRYIRRVGYIIPYHPVMHSPCSIQCWRVGLLVYNKGGIDSTTNVNFIHVQEKLQNRKRI